MVENAALPRQPAPSIALSRFSARVFARKCRDPRCYQGTISRKAGTDVLPIGRRKPGRAGCEVERRRGAPGERSGAIEVAEHSRTVFSISLSGQEQEFAAACRDFVLQEKPELRSSIVVANNMLSIADQPHVRQAFMELGLARLVRVLRLAIVGKAIAIRRAPRLLFDLARFRTKIVRALRRRAG